MEKKAKEYAEAARSYTRAIELESDPVELAKLLGNRSTSYGLLQKHLEALSDAKRRKKEEKREASKAVYQAMGLSRSEAHAKGLAGPPRGSKGRRQQPSRVWRTPAGPGGIKRSSTWRCTEFTV